MFFSTTIQNCVEVLGCLDMIYISFVYFTKMCRSWALLIEKLCISKFFCVSKFGKVAATSIPAENRFFSAHAVLNCDLYSMTS
jgi:hypothetical protein